MNEIGRGDRYSDATKAIKKPGSVASRQRRAAQIRKTRKAKPWRNWV
jgi:hypothetical protein